MTERHDLARLAAQSSEGAPTSESAAVAARRLGITAVVIGAAHVVYSVLYRTVWSELSNPVGLAMGLVGLGISAAVAAYLLTGARPASRVAIAGAGYEVFLALALGFSEATAADHRVTSAQVSWVAVVIMLFPFLIPAGPRVVFSAAVASAAMTPLSMAVVFAWRGQPWPPPDVTVSFLLPPFLCAVLAWAPTRVLSRLAAEVRQARRIGNYELGERLGEGGMGEVWRAKHRLLARPAAVKLIKPEVLGAKDSRARTMLVERFEREAQVTASLGSAHTIDLYDFGVSAGGELFYVMELLAGLDLETLVQRFGPLPSERVVHVLLQACDSLEEAHARGLIHRDIKPANLFVARKGSTVDFVKVLDFGLVKRWNQGEGDALVKSLGTTATAPTVAQTAAGQIVGTPAFLAPEAALGEKAVDQRADIYALGCVGYWLLTGAYVFDADTVIGMALAHVSKVPERPSARTEQPITPALEAVLMRCLEKDREARPQSAAALRDALAAIALPESWTRERAQAWWRQHLPATAV